MAVPESDENVALLAGRLRTGNCVLYAGSGLSAMAGLPTRYDFSRRLVELFGSESDRDMVQSAFSASDADALVHNIVRDHPAEVFGLVRQIADSGAPLSEAHRLLASLPFKAAITSNWDRLLERTFPEARVIYPQDVTEFQSSYLKDQFFLLKLTGDPDQPDSLVVTDRDYERQFAQNPWFASVLYGLFLQQTVVFIGCSWEGIDSVLRAARFFQPAGQHIALMLTDGSGHRWQARARQFADQYNIATIPFERPEHLLEILRQIGGAENPASTGRHAEARGPARVPKRMTLRGHSGTVWAVAVTPDGSMAVSGSEDQTVKVWDLASGQLLLTLQGHTETVLCVAVTPDGTKAISGGDDRSIRIWDLASGRLLRTVSGHTGDVFGIGVTGDGAQILSAASDRTLCLWDLDSGHLIRTFRGHTASVYCVAIAPDGLRAVSASEDWTLKVWDLSSGIELRTLEGHTASVHAAAWTPDGRHIVSGSADNSIRIWDLDSTEPSRVLEGHSDWVQSVAVTPDGTIVVSGSEDNTLGIWELASGKALRTLGGHSDSVQAVCITPDGSRAVSGSDDGTIRVWDLTAAPSRLHRASFQNVGPFGDLDLDFEANWTIFIGNNGAGKSTILKALAVALCGADASAWADRLIRAGQPQATITLWTDDETYRTVIRRRPGGSGADIESFPLRAVDGEGWLVLGFPPLRTGSWNSASAQPEGSRIPTTDDVLPLVRGEADPRLDRLKQWLVSLDYRLSKGETLMGQLLADFFSKVALLLDDAPMDFERIDGKTRQVFVRTYDGSIPIEQISQGMASLVSWVGVLLQRLYEVFEGESPSEHYALVLMDEIDAHMHPAWQQILVSRLKDLFPNVQFVATTHSPLIVAGRSRGEIRVFTRDENSKRLNVTRPAMDFRGLRADQILTSWVFGLAGARDIETVRLQHRYRELLNKPNLTDNEQKELDDLSRHQAIVSSPVEETLRLEAIAKSIKENITEKDETEPIPRRTESLLEAEELFERGLRNLNQ